MRLSEVRGVPVLTVEEGRILGKLENLLVDAALRAAAFLVVQSPNWFEGPLAVPMDRVTGMGNHAVIIQNATTVHPIAENERAARLAMQHLTVIGCDVYTPQGDMLGSVQDISFGIDGRIIELLLEEDRTVPARDVLALGGSFIFANGDGKVPAAVPEPASELPSLGFEAETPLADDIEGPLPERGLVGRKLLRDVEGHLGLIGRAGDVITREMVDIALDAGKLVELTTNSVA